MTLLLSVLFGLLSMVSYGFANAFSKPLSQQLGPSRTLYLRGIAVCVILLAAAAPSYGRMQHHGIAVIATLALGIAGYLPVLAFTHGIRQARLGVVAPIAATAPLVTVLMSFLFLDVQISSAEWVAIIAVVSANVFVCVDFRNWKESSIFQLSSGVPFGVMAAIGWGFFYFFLVSSTRALGPWLSA